MVDIAKRLLFRRKAIDPTQIRLPWVNNLEQFTDICTRCGKCEEVCETGIIYKGDGGYPAINFTVDECTFCYKCAEICPEPIFNGIETQPWNAKAVINDTCLAHNNVECRSCGDSCETMAITFKLRAGGVALPQLELADCNGCGACVSPCPTSSISVSNV
ncbi:ferredoxin-type protein NapF [Vibrio sp. 10N]|uniref:ferredoxin-type protein NapF n=1 Tax=Vibrio sp. 10N TaxID=3058938 RepID=UPI0028131B82|nr:ferredoxin-type protein NapF [Vibrio sp. 10N]